MHWLIDRTSWTEPIVLLLILVNVVTLTLQSAQNVYDQPRPTGAGYFHTWKDLLLFILFVAFSAEIAARILVSGLIFDPEERPHAKTIKGKAKVVWDRLLDRDQVVTGKIPLRDDRSTRVPELPYGRVSTDASSLALHASDKAEGLMSRRQYSQTSFSYPPVSAQPTLRSYKSNSHLLSAAKTPNSTLNSRRGLASSTFHEDMPFVQASQVQQDQTLHHQKAFLRHSWNRVDALAVLSFWIMFALAFTGVESKHSVYVFRALSTLRAARLLTITAGTTASRCTAPSQFDMLT